MTLLVTTALAAASPVVSIQAHAQSAPKANQDGRTAFNIATQPLSKALVQFSNATGAQLFFGASLARGKTSQGARGAFTRGEALSRILAGSGLNYRINGNTITLGNAVDMGSVGSVDAEGGTVLAPINVDGGGVSLQDEGKAEDGYRARTLSSVGPFSNMPLLNTPYSVSVVPRELLQNIQAQSPDDVYKLNPSTRTSVPQVTGWSPMVNIRGFSTYDTAEDGLRRSYSHVTVLEDKERIEILNGLSGFLYGAAAPGGMINYVYKRPTFERLNSVTIGNYGGSQAYLHGDFGGRIDEEGRLGYRLNVVKQGGDTAIDDQSIKRGLISGALDWQITDKLKLELNAVYNKYETDNASTYWFFDGVPHGKAPDASKNWGQPWIRDEFENKKLMAKLTYELSEDVTLRGAYMREYVDRPVQDHIMNAVSSSAGYNQIGIHSGPSENVFDAAQAFADISLDTGPIAHKLTMGYHMYSDRSWGSEYNVNTGWTGPYPWDSPTHLPTPDFPPDTSDMYYKGFVRNHNFVVGDQIQFNDQWSALVGVNYSRIVNVALESSGARSQPDYDQGRVSPSVSVMYKPMPWMTLYGSYMEGLEQGGIAPDTATNPNAVMAPMVSKQKEIGIKAELGNVLLTGALFDIEKAYEFTDSNNVYTQDGRQNHRGVEFTATGKLTDDLTIVGGVTLLNARVVGGESDGNAPMNVANVLAKIYAEYEVPGMPGLILTGGVYHTGKQWANDANTDRLPAYTTLDLGMRYTTEISGRPLTLRLSANNVTNENYWQNSYYLGAPRSIAFSAQMKF
jgi:iron complex outermembrane receptor protein